MSGTASKDGQDGSYSMYPPTSPAVPPASMQYQMAGVYGNPNTFAQYGYGYPMPMDMYAGQGAPFMGYGMNPGMMYYGGNNSGNSGVPPPSGQKRKYYNNNNNNNNNTNTNTTNNNTNSNSKPDNGGKSAESPYYSNVKSGSVSGGSTNVSSAAANGTKSVPITIKNQYKFELGNSNSVSTTDLKLEYPFYSNTDPNIFRKAQVRRTQVTLRALNDVFGASFGEQLSDAGVETDGETIQEVTDQFQTAPATVPSTQDENAQAEESLTPTPEVASLPELKEVKGSVEEPVKAVPARTIKSWSAVASSAAGTNGSAKSANVSFDKKDKKYVPPTVKSLEPVGVVALRVCFDPEYVKYTTEHSKGTGMALQSVIPRGIVNSGNICFMSSILQTLLFCQPFINLMNLVSIKTPAKMGSTGFLLLDACLELYRKFDKQVFEREKAVRAENGDVGISSALTTAIKPEDFYKTLSKLPKFKDLKWGHQEDAEEFLTHLLDQLHEEFVHSINVLSEGDISNLIKSINDEDSKLIFIRNLATYKNAEFIKKPSSDLKNILDKYGVNADALEEDQEKGWQEVSSTSKKGKKTKTAAKRTVIVVPSPISVIFGGQFRSVLDVPQNKEPQSITLDPFQTIQLDISESNVEDLDSAFRKFSESEQIPFKTSSGNSVEAKKQTFIDKLPQVLLIQLKRFSFINNTDKSKIVNYNAYSGHVEKIRKKIQYGHELTIPDESISSVHSAFYKQSGSAYKLIGVVYHHGLSPSGGHYTCDVFQEALSKWYRIDDVNVQEIDKEEVLKGGEEGKDPRTAYILIYQKL
ncbi:LANO_0F03510g1_1 [Lachancea nothofagi CBS 11611]|uniref:Ubiquitin carboxyl-terminal hydrolase n=1 Tax=Lachancea nothofagi CBS 11611 TaxID=1266666 RepID=A0A1G4K792_9SACH|nr:LANO_0F03510g1_1 [Lachancea nothofagi CBS 11611]